MARLIAQRGRDGQWRVYARAFLFQNPGGKQVVNTQTCYGTTEKEALSAAAKFIADERDTYAKTGKASKKPCKETLAVYGRAWLDARKPTGADSDVVKRSTWEGYDALFRAYVEEPKDVRLRLGHVAIAELTAEDVERCYKALGNKARALHAVLRQVFKRALSTGATKEALDLQLRGVFGRRKGHKRPAAYTEEQLTAFLRAADTDRYRAFWYLFASTGMRPGELLALTVEDVDLDALVVNVSKRIRHLPERSRTDIEVRFEIDEPKTEDSVREIAIPEDLVPILKEHLAAMPRRKFAGRYGRLLFTTQSGEPVDWINMRAKLGTFGIAPTRVKGKPGPAKEGKFTPLLKPYALRHTYMTLGLDAGVPIEVLAEVAGHADGGALARRTYIAPRTKRQRGAAAAVGARLRAIAGR